MYPSLWQYRKLGGWLMFINVVQIIGIISGFFSVLMFSTVIILMGVLPGTGDPIFDSLMHGMRGYFSVMMIPVVIIFALSICAVIFLSQRKLRPFRATFLAEYGTNAALYLTFGIFFMAVPLPDLFTIFFNGLPADFYADLNSAPMEGFLHSFRIIYAFMFTFFALVSIGIGVAWWFYLKKSKRVKVYFDPIFPEPPPQYLWDTRAAWQRPEYQAQPYPYGQPAHLQGQYPYTPGYSPQQPYHLPQPAVPSSDVHLSQPYNIDAVRNNK